MHRFSSTDFSSPPDNPSDDAQHIFVFRKLFGNENGANPTHSMNAECSEDNDMIAMERQLAARAARTSRTSDATSTQSSAINKQRGLHPGSLPPAPQRSPTPESPEQPSSLPPSSPQESAIPTRSPTPDPPVNSRKQKAVPTRLPTPDPPVDSRKRKQVPLQPSMMTAL
ncbi:hypothetical protein EDB19DRAFT_1728958 [Suillus lakei]|nr:hypothetical protein EDB19DRAFT_1728958 [Suillus lakei]